jgi:prepilin-type N-terminal cleavage/methylation domain-containing protein
MIGKSGEQNPDCVCSLWVRSEREELFTPSPDHPITRSSVHPITRSPDRAGFTLFEVLISLTLIGFIMLALLIGMRVASRAWRTGEARLRQVHAAAEQSDFVVTQVSSLVPYRISSSDPSLPGALTVLEATADCLRFISSYSSVYRSRTGLVLVEYGIVAPWRGEVEVVLRETPVADNQSLYHKLILSVTHEPDTGLAVINYQPFVARASDLRLMTGLSGAAFSYLDLHPQKSPVPLWRQDWRSSVEAPYPDAIRLQWERGRERVPGEEVMPVRAKFMPLAQ